MSLLIIMTPLRITLQGIFLCHLQKNYIYLLKLMSTLTKNEFYDFSHINCPFIEKLIKFRFIEILHIFQFQQ